MGKRKSRSSKLVAQPKKALKLEKVFTCPFCNHPESVKCRIHLKYGTRRRCVSSATRATAPSQVTSPRPPTSTGHEWIGECERANQGIHVRRRR
ncbi:unnamed protein product [Urochloa humidicola]